MILTRRFPRRLLVGFFVRIAVPQAAWALVVYLLYKFGGLEWLRVPFLPVASIGTAVAFYVGFKNNSAYERFWEGRKIWGGIVNSSRTWGTFVTSYVRPGDDSPEAAEVRGALVRRHIAWINALRLQLRRTSRFFHKPAPSTRRRLEAHAEVMRNDWDQEISPWLSPEEHAAMKARKNAATQLLTRQGAELASLKSRGQVDLFHQIAMMEVVEELYTLQGKCERIKNTPFPRQYAEYSRLFVRVFTFMVPLGLLDVFAPHIVEAHGFLPGVAVALPMIVAAALVSWVFVTMEGIGDSSEDPFERSMNDVPMNALCRTIEIDLLEMIGETDLPAKEEAVDHILY